MNLTAKQLEVCRFIWSYRREHGISPTLGEIAEGLGGVAKVTVWEHVEILEGKGAVRRDAKYKSRSLTVTRALARELEAIARPNPPRDSAAAASKAIRDLAAAFPRTKLEDAVEQLVENVSRAIRGEPSKFEVGARLVWRGAGEEE